MESVEWDALELEADAEPEHEHEHEPHEELEVATGLVRTTKLRRGETPILTRRPMGGRPTFWVFRR